MGTLAFAAYLLFIVSWFLHLGSRVQALGAIRFDLLLLVAIVVLTGLGEASHEPADGDRAAGTAVRRLIATLAAYAVLTVPFVQWPGSVLRAGLPEFIKAVVFFYFTSKLVATPARLRVFLVVFVLAQTARVLEPVYLHVTTGYWGSGATMAGGERLDRLAGSPYDVLNPNGLAFVILTLLPFLHYLAPLTRTGALGYAGLLPILIYALLLTGSRSGLLGLGMIVVAVWLKTPRKLLLGVTIAVAMIAALPTLSDDMRDRYRSIVDSNTKNAQTAQGRLEGNWNDLNVALRRPLFGHGLGTSREANANFGGIDQVSHNLYTQAAQELGFIGLTIVVAMLAAIVASLTQSLRLLRQAPGASRLLLRLTDATQVFVVMNVLFSFASYGLASYEWYFAAGLSEVVRRSAVELAPLSEADGNPTDQDATASALRPDRDTAAGRWPCTSC